MSLVVTGRQGNVILLGQAAPAEVKRFDSLLWDRPSITVTAPKRAGKMAVYLAGKRSALVHIEEDTSADLASEMLVYAMQRTLTLIEMADPEWVDIGGEA